MNLNSKPIDSLSYEFIRFYTIFFLIDLLSIESFDALLNANMNKNECYERMFAIPADTILILFKLTILKTH